MPINKQYLLQLGESVLLAALLAVYPLLSSGHIDWIAIVIVVVFAVAHSLAKYVNNGALRDAINADLNALQSLPFRSAWAGTSAKQPPQPLTLPAVPKSDGTSQQQS